jgi:hypothetical protein
MIALLSTRDAARTLKLSVRTLERLRVSGGGPKYIKIGRCVRYEDPAIQSWLSDHTVSSTSEADHG